MNYIFQGASGASYSFRLYSISEPPDIKHCVYIYAAQDGECFSPVYIGMTTRSFAERHHEHETADNGRKAFCIGFHEGFHILIHEGITGCLSECELAYRESDLIDKYDPPCNEKV